MIDTHTHLYFNEDYPDGGASTVDRALEAGVSRMILPNVSVDSCEPLLRLHWERPEATHVAVGMHPEDADSDWRPKMEDIFSRFENENPCAVGEIGVDLFHDSRYRIEQMDLFGEQLERARTMCLPIIIHSRNALDETLHVLKLMGPGLPPMVFHSFTSDSADARKILEFNPEALFGINGVVTFKNAPALQRAVIEEIGAERIVLETDAPYLSPVPLRGRTNESANIPYIRDKIAALSGLTAEDIERITDNNARRIFKI